MIQVSQLSKYFGPVRALDRVSFEVPEREVVGFLGPNGAGKTTTLRILTGFFKGDSGSVRVAGYDVAREPLLVRRSIGYLPEGVPLYPEMRVNEFLSFRARLKGVPHRERRKEVDAVLDMTGITDVRKRIVGTLSKGYRQRVGISDALIGRPPVLILDEPTVGLDPEQVLQVRELLRRVGEDRTVILSTHILSEVEIVCSRTIIISRGRIAAQDTAEGLRQRVRAAARIRVELDGPSTEVCPALEKLAGVEELEVLEPDPKNAGNYRSYRIRSRRDTDPREGIFRLARDKQWTLTELYREPVTLEDAFLEIVGDSEKNDEG